MSVLNESFYDNPQGGQETKCFSEDIREEELVKVLYSPPPHKKPFFPPLQIHSTTQRARTSGKFKQECKLRDVYRKTEIDCIKWQPVWSPGRSSNQTFPLRAKQLLFTFVPCMSCWDQQSGFWWFIATGHNPLEGWRPTSHCTSYQIGGKIHTEGTRTWARLNLHDEISQSQQKPGLLQLLQSNPQYWVGRQAAVIAMSFSLHVQ